MQVRTGGARHALRLTLGATLALGGLPLLLSTAAPPHHALATAGSLHVLPASGPDAVLSEAIAPAPSDTRTQVAAAVMNVASTARPGRSRDPSRQALTFADIPAEAMTAYQRAATVLGQVDPACGLRWTLLAAIGRVESNHGRHGGAAIGTDGVARPSIIGPALDGTGPVASLRDSDGGQWDEDPEWDRAVGPMQFIPQTWALVGTDGDGDGTRSPHDIDDAALAAAVYLCFHGSDLSTPVGMRAALLRYNRSDTYAALVTAYEKAYARGRGWRWVAPAVAPLTHLSLGAGPGVFARPDARQRGTAARAQRRLAREAERRQERLAARSPAGAHPSAPGSSVSPSIPDAPPAPPGEPSEPSGPTGPTGPTDVAPEAPPAPPGAPSTDPDPGAAPGPDDPLPAPPDGSAGASPDGDGTKPGDDSPSDGTASPEDPSEDQQPAEPPSPPPPDDSPSEGDGGGEAVARSTGVLAACATTWCLGTQVLDVGSPTVLDETAPGDLDGDGTTRTRREELTGLGGRSVTITYVDDTASWLLLSVNGVRYR